MNITILQHSKNKMHKIIYLYVFVWQCFCDVLIHLPYIWSADGFMEFLEYNRLIDTVLLYETTCQKIHWKVHCQKNLSDFWFVIFTCKKCWFYLFLPWPFQSLSVVQFSNMDTFKILQRTVYIIIFKQKFTLFQWIHKTILVALLASGAYKQNPEELSGQFEGDIILNKEQADYIYGGQRTGLIDNRYRWPNRVVAYNLSDVFTAAQIAHIELGLRTLESKTCLRFVPYTNEAAYVQVTVGIHSI